MKKISLISLIFLSLTNLIIGQTTTQDSVNIKIILTDMDSIAETNALITVKSDDGSFKLRNHTDELGSMLTVLPLGKNLEFTVHRYDTTISFKQNIPVNNYGDNIIPFNLKIGVTVSERIIRKFNLPIHFESSKYELISENKAIIKDLLDQLEHNKKMSIIIGAHTDNVGSGTYNQNLSQQRANAVRSYLISSGIDGNRIIAKGYGENKPIGDNNTEEGRQQNRRVEIEVIEE